MSFYSEFSNQYEEAFPLREEVIGFLRNHFPEKVSAILDLGCGPGHYCGRFQQEGFGMMGIDLDKKMIEAARKRYPDARFECMDMNGIETVTERFETIYSVGNVIAHITPEQLRRLLPVISKLLFPGGYWIFQIVNWDYLLTLARYTFPAKTLEGGSLTFHREYENISEKRVTFHTFLQSEDKLLFDERLPLYPLRSDDYLKYHSSAGFQPVGLYADFNKKEYRKNTESGAIYVFRKKRLPSKLP
ncbi:MAG: methyltransferase domain-containing protein [Prosthecochloris sp.]|nr:methyltransferase domain-containing protein [Prosthecochloris sp.]